MTQPTLFDQPANIPMANKIDSFYSEDTQTKRVSQKERIYQMLKEMGPATQREISEDTGIARHLIPDRLLVLQRENKVKITGAVIDNLTNREVTVYEAI
jgi:hypothetical protein